MIACKLGHWQEHYPDGVSLGMYQRLARTIRQHGPIAVIRVTPGDYDSLRRALDELDAR